MKKHHNIYLIVLLFAILIKLNAANYYVCDCMSGSNLDCIQGQDGFEGSIAQPFQSMTKANQTFNAISAGDSILFCNGGAWITSTNLRWVNLSCQQDNICTISDYMPPWATGDEQKPILNFHRSRRFYQYHYSKQ